mgnify:CR=1 FL=1
MTSVALAAALGVIDLLVPAAAPYHQQLIASKCRALMFGYQARWAGDVWRPIALEAEVVAPIINPSTGRASRTWRQAAKLDGVVTDEIRAVVLEHKTTSDEIDDPSCAYRRRLQIDSQLSAYLRYGKQLGVKLEGSLYDVIRKPNSRPKEIFKKDRQRIRQEATYFGQRVSHEEVITLSDAPDAVESLALLEARLRATLVDEGQRYYQRWMVQRLQAELDEYAHELWAIAKNIHHDRRHDARPRGPGRLDASISPRWAARAARVR